MHPDKHQSCLQGDAIIIDGHDQAFLKYSKDKVWNTPHYHFLYADKHQGFYKLALLLLMEVAKHVQSTQNRKLVKFLQYIMKKVSQQLAFYCDENHLDIFRDPVTFVVTCFWVVVVKNGHSLSNHGTLKSDIYIYIYIYIKYISRMS